MFTFADLFCGIGGFRMALENCGGRCVFSSEIDPACKKVYADNFGETPSGDIRETAAEDIPDHDVLCAGFPCQAFSIAGRKEGFGDERGALFFEIMRIAEAKKPRALLLENVKHLLSHDSGKTIRTIREGLEGLGYTVSVKLLNSKDFGLAQNRERTIIVAGDRELDFGRPDPKDTNIKDIPELQKRDVLPAEQYTILDKSLWKKQESGLMFVGHRNRPMRKKGIRAGTEHLSRSHKQPNRIYHAGGKHPTLSAAEQSGRYWVWDGERVVKMTPRDCHILQGFPNTFKMHNSPSAAYRQAGNSVSVPVIQSVMEDVRSQLLWIRD